ncbi:MAG: hypothetical protein ACR2K6_02625 [Solirubrobacterales bacterium]
MASSDQRAAPAPGLDAPFALFSFLVALALILHQLWWDGFDARHGALMVAAGWTLLRPGSVPRFSLLMGVAVFTVAGDMPNVGDHILLVTVIGFFVLVQTAWMMIGSGGLPSGAELFERIAPMLRASAVVLYAAAALAKLNLDFFNPAVSCAREELSRIPLVDPGTIGAWSVEAAIVATIVTEIGLAVLLAVPRTRVVGLVVGGGFHIVLALAGNVPFAAVMAALYVAFLPSTAPATAQRTLRRWFGPVVEAVRPPTRPEGVAALAVMVVLWQLGGRLTDAAPDLVEVLLEVIPRVVVIGLIGGTLILWIGSGGPLGSGREHIVGSLRRLAPILALGLAVLVVNAASPYLGLKTQTSFNMFSNLRTEAGRWNHVLVPESVRIFGYQDQLVEVTSSNDPVLARNAERGEQVARLELERYLRRHPDAYATYIDAEGRRRLMVADGAGSPVRQVADKVARFQPVPEEGSRC